MAQMVKSAWILFQGTYSIVTELNWTRFSFWWTDQWGQQDELFGYWLTSTWALLRRPRRSPTPLDGASCNALLPAHWSLRQKLNHVSSVQFFNFVALYEF